MATNKNAAAYRAAFTDEQWAKVPGEVRAAVEHQLAEGTPLPVTTTVADLQDTLGQPDKRLCLRLRVTRDAAARQSRCTYGVAEVPVPPTLWARATPAERAVLEAHLAGAPGALQELLVPTLTEDAVLAALDREVTRAARAAQEKARELEQDIADLRKRLDGRTKYGDPIPYVPDSFFAQLPPELQEELRTAQSAHDEAVKAEREAHEAKSAAEREARKAQEAAQQAEWNEAVRTVLLSEAGENPVPLERYEAGYMAMSEQEDILRAFQLEEPLMSEGYTLAAEGRPMGDTKSLTNDEYRELMRLRASLVAHGISSLPGFIVEVQDVKHSGEERWTHEARVEVSIGGRALVVWVELDPKAEKES